MSRVILYTRLLILVSLFGKSFGDENHELIEKAAAALTDDGLQEDQLLVQTIEEGHSVYSHSGGEKHGDAVFLRSGDDTGKPLVILAAGEDYLPKCSSKRTYVVLKQTASNPKEYRAIFGYVRLDHKIEWDSWSARGNWRNKALLFGLTGCGTSSMVPCKSNIQSDQDDSADYEDFGEDADGKPKPKFPLKHPKAKSNPMGVSDYYCDLLEFTTKDKKFIGNAISALVQSMTIINAAHFVYKDENELVNQVHGEIKQAGPTLNDTVQAKATLGLISTGREAISGGVMYFYAAIVRLGALAVNELPPDEIKPPPPEDITDKLTMQYKTIGLTLLKGFYHGVDHEDQDQKVTNPSPHILLNEYVVTTLLKGRSVGEAVDENAAKGRASGGSASEFLSKSNRFEGTAQDGSYTGSKAIDNIRSSVLNIFVQEKKPAGQIFSENLAQGFYVPQGLVEDGGDLIGRATGIGKISNDKTFLDDFLAKALYLVGGAIGNIVQSIGDILAPMGLGGVWAGVAGYGAAVIGATAGAAFQFPLMMAYNGVKLGAKALGYQEALGMRATGQEYVAKPTPVPATQYMAGRRKRNSAAGPGYPVLNDHVDMVTITDLDLFTHLGWKLMEIKHETLSIAQFTDPTPFVGFGNCVFKPLTQDDFVKATTAKEVAKLYMQAMRTECLKDQVDSITDIIHDGLLHLNPKDKTFDIPDSLPLLKKAKLTPAEINSLSKAFEFSKFSKAYHESWTSVPPAGISRSAQTFRLMCQKYLDGIASKAPIHRVKLKRNLGKLVRTAFIKSLQDFFRYKFCKNCKEEAIKDVHGDVALVEALMEYILRESDKPAYKGTVPSKAFDKFYKESHVQITKQLYLYFQ